MKQIFIFKSFLVCFCVFTSYHVMAQGTFVVDNIKYDYQTNGATTVSVVANNYSGDLTIPASVTHGNTKYDVTAIGMNAFAYLNNLNSLTLPNSIIWIMESAFENCSGLTSITLSSSLAQIDKYAFLNVSGLTSIVSLNPEPPTVNNNAFLQVGLFSNATVKVPIGSLQKYKTAFGWSQFENIIEFVPTGEEIMAGNLVKVYADADFVVVKGVGFGQNINVYTTTGAPVKLVVANNDVVKIELQANQIYIVNIGKDRYKVAL